MQEDLVLRGYLDMEKEDGVVTYPEAKNHFVPVYLKRSTDYEKELKRIDAVGLDKKPIVAVPTEEKTKTGRPRKEVPVSTVKKLRKAGMSNRAIARQLNVSEGTIRKVV